MKRRGLWKEPAPKPVPVARKVAAKAVEVPREVPSGETVDLSAQGHAGLVVKLARFLAGLNEAERAVVERELMGVCRPPARQAHAALEATREFLLTQLEVSPGYNLTSVELYAGFRRWCGARDWMTGGMRRFCWRLSELMPELFDSYRSKSLERDGVNTVGYRGIYWRATAIDELGVDAGSDAEAEKGGAK